MKKIWFLLIAGMCLLLSSCGSSEKQLSISTPEVVIVTYYSGESDEHVWKLSQDEINDWVVWLNNFTVSPINLEESKTLINRLYSNGKKSGYSFDAGAPDALEKIVYLEYGSEHAYLRMDNAWYCVKNPTEPFNRY